MKYIILLKINVLTKSRTNVFWQRYGAYNHQYSSCLFRHVTNLNHIVINWNQIATNWSLILPNFCKLEVIQVVTPIVNILAPMRSRRHILLGETCHSSLSLPRKHCMLQSWTEQICMQNCEHHQTATISTIFGSANVNQWPQRNRGRRHSYHSH